VGEKRRSGIARHWIHHNNNRCLEQHDPSMVSESLPTPSPPSMDEPEGSKMPGLRIDEPFAPCPKFKWLIGISVKENAKTVNWLLEQCPRLFIFKKGIGGP